MTAWNDQPPISRRQVRQNERAENSDTPAGAANTPVEKPGYGAIPRESWDTDARRAAAEEELRARPRPDDAPPLGRRAQKANDPAPEPLNYVTQARPQVPTYDGPSFRRGNIAAVPERPASSGHNVGSHSAGSYPGANYSDRDIEDSEPTAPAATPFRVRDFSPEGRRSTFTPTTPEAKWAPPVIGEPAPGEVNHHTESTSSRWPTPVAPPAREPVQPPSVDYTGPIDVPTEVDEPVVEHTMTRRELRAREQAALEAAAASNAGNAPIELFRPRERRGNPLTSDAAQASALAAALAEFDSRANTAPAAPPTLSQPEPAAEEPSAVAESGAAVEPTDAAPVAEPKPVTATIFVVSTESVEAQEFEVTPPAAEAETPDVGHDLFAGLLPDAAELLDVPEDAVTDVADTAVAEPWPFSVASAAQPTATQPPAPQPPAPQAPIYEAPVDGMRFEQLLTGPVLTDSVVEHPATAPAEPAVVPPAPGSYVGPPIVAPAPAPAPPAAPAPVATQPAAASIFAAPAPTGEAAPFAPPVGHWTTQASIDDDEQFIEQTLSRNVGATSGAITSNALVMPAMPVPDGILSPLGSTGEILITGSINLPSTLGHTGAVPANYDHSDVDALLSADDREDSDSGTAPVRAIRAVSTHTLQGAAITTGKPKANNKLAIVAITASVVAIVGIVGLLIAAVALNLI